MKGIKNSLKKLSFNLSLARESVQSIDSEIVPDIEAKRHFYRANIAQIVSYQSYEFPGDAVHTRVLETIEDLEVREDDVFVVSYPASCGHFLEDIVHSLLTQDQRNRGKSEEDINATPARLEVSNPYGHIRWLKSLKSPRLIVTSLPYDLLPRQLQTPNARVIYLARNPKDHMVAYYYHHRLKGVQLSMDDFLDLYLNGYLLYGNYFDHVISYWQLSQLYPSNVLFICYEELKLITLPVAKSIASFLHLNLNEEEIEIIINQKHGKANAIDCDDLKRGSAELSQRVNKFHGVLGDWVNYFSPDQARRMDEMIRLKFKSQKLSLVDDATAAIRQINKYGRLKLGVNSISTESNAQRAWEVGDALLSMAPRSRTAFRKKPIFTKDEAIFIRKKDKVVIVEESGPIGGEPHTSWFIRLLTLICCCGFRPKSGYARF